jgi:L-threonine-O-3-phosphate decarboxylase
VNAVASDPLAAGHGGNRLALAARAGRLPADILDFSANINPFGTPEIARAAVQASAAALADYPDPECTLLREAIGAHLDVHPQTVLPGNGAEQLIWWLPRLVAARRVVVTAPCYLDYRRSAAVWGLEVVDVALEEAMQFSLVPQRLDAAAQDGDLVWIGRPNNPTGRCVDLACIRRLAMDRSQVWWAVDEAFIDFVHEPDSAVTLSLSNVIVVRSMTKFYALAGLRLGYAVLSPDLASAGRRLLPDWSVSTPAQRAGHAVLTDPELQAFADASRKLIRRERIALADALRRLGVVVTEGAANYLLLRLPEAGPSAAVLAERLLVEAGIAVRTCSDYVGLTDRHLRIAVRSSVENARLIASLGDLLCQASNPPLRESAPPA